MEELYLQVSIIECNSVGASPCNWLWKKYKITSVEKCGVIAGMGIGRKVVRWQGGKDDSYFHDIIMASENARYHKDTGISTLTNNSTCFCINLSEVGTA